MIPAVLKRRFYKHLWLFRPLTYLLILILIILGLGLLMPLIIKGSKTFIKSSSALVSLINPGFSQLTSFRERTNILLLGVGGGDHPGGDLTDSQMLISVDLVTGDTVLISLPRDIWVESLAAKLNTAYHYGEIKEAGSGLKLAKAAVSEISNLPIHYAVLIDFSGFEKAIDTIGGIDLDIPHSFIDNQYPIPGKESAEPEASRYETIQFTAGRQHLDGMMALKYIRSRHAQGEEGTDYARSQRQQLVILAVKDKLLSSSTLLSFNKLNLLKQNFFDSVKTDIAVNAYPDMFKLFLRLDKSKIRSGILDQGSESEDIPPLLYNPPANIYGQWVLLPVGNNWQAIHQYISDLIYQNRTLQL